MREMADSKEDLEKFIAGRCGHDDFELVPLITEKWNDDLSPWKFDDNKNSFGGKAEFFLERVGEAVESHRKSVEDRFVIAGYSLAGLFSLWAATQMGVFDSVVCCSGSLWFPGFLEAELLPACRYVYLSLGDKEAKTKHPLMSKVESITQEYSDFLKSAGTYEAVLFEMNQGNHFADPVDRMAKGIASCLSDKSNIHWVK